MKLQKIDIDNLSDEDSNCSYCHSSSDNENQDHNDKTPVVLTHITPIQIQENSDRTNSKKINNVSLESEIKPPNKTVD